MAGLFPPATGICRLLDAGAGIGILAAAFLERWRSRDLCFQCVELDAFEIDHSLHDDLAQTLSKPEFDVRRGLFSKPSSGIRRVTPMAFSNRVREGDNTRCVRYFR